MRLNFFGKEKNIQKVSFFVDRILYRETFFKCPVKKLFFVPLQDKSI